MLKLMLDYLEKFVYEALGSLLGFQVKPGVTFVRLEGMRLTLFVGRSFKLSTTYALFLQKNHSDTSCWNRGQRISSVMKFTRAAQIIKSYERLHLVDFKGAILVKEGI